MSLSKRQSKALEKSILKWEAIAEGEGEDNGRDNCSLCELYRTFMITCKFCPVKLKTKNSGCRDTPYPKWEMHQNYKHNLDSDKGMKRIKGCSTCTRLARKELNFLKELREL